MIGGWGRDLRMQLCGCGMLSQFELRCETLASLDATFCRALHSESLWAVPALCPALQSMSLAYCPISSEVLATMFCGQQLASLTFLDLSYTEVSDADAVVTGCPALGKLKLTACKYMCREAMLPFLQGGRAPSLADLDLSYCTLPEEALRQVLVHGQHLQVLNLSACGSVTRALWERPPSKPAEAAASAPLCNALTDLACTGCPSLFDVQILHRHPMYAMLQTLSLRLTAVTRVELELECLRTLDLRECAQLEQLHLCCPRLSTLDMQLCTALPPHAVQGALRGLNELEMLDVRDMVQLSVEDLRGLPSLLPQLRRFLTSTGSGSD
ncbi:hypothetical protein CYMTET_45242 [Cymbomonas tetramitiformis]|uniref:Uncharacterized protein n=1 Tax=Cymbomonas tetramitiformis TaxID=36881 RepID=A0AAE0BZV3_9CHLO|nr:hypothetical protein CYMTET_45242 [Cymbomonas tetramitiformis]